MSSHGMSWARQQRTGNLTTKALLLLLGELVNDEGETTRGQQYLAEILEVHIDTIRRGLGKLEEQGLIARERRQATDTRRLHDRIKLLMQPSFEVINEDPDTEPSAESYSRNDANPAETEPSTKLGNEPSTKPLNEPSTKLGIKDNHSLNPSITQNSDGAASGTAQAGTAMELPGMPPRQDLVKADPKPEQQIAAWAYEKTNKGLKYQAMMSLGREAIAHGYQPGEVAKTMVAMFHAGRNVNAQSLAQALQGIINPAGQTPKPSTTNARVGAALDRAARYEQQAANAHS